MDVIMFSDLLANQHPFNDHSVINSVVNVSVALVHSIVNTNVKFLSVAHFSNTYMFPNIYLNDIVTGDPVIDSILPQLLGPF